MEFVRETNDVLELLNWEQMLKIGYFFRNVTLSHLKNCVSSKCLCLDFKTDELLSSVL
jgi:hypothetical protein